MENISVSNCRLPIIAALLIPALLFRYGEAYALLASISLALLIKMDIAKIAGVRGSKAYSIVLATISVSSISIPFTLSFLGAPSQWGMYTGVINALAFLVIWLQINEAENNNA